MFRSAQHDIACTWPSNRLVLAHPHQRLLLHSRLKRCGPLQPATHTLQLHANPAQRGSPRRAIRLCDIGQANALNRSLSVYPLFAHHCLHQAIRKGQHVYFFPPPEQPKTDRRRPPWLLQSRRLATANHCLSTTNIAHSFCFVKQVRAFVRNICSAHLFERGARRNEGAGLAEKSGRASRPL